MVEKRISPLRGSLSRFGRNDKFVTGKGNGKCRFFDCAASLRMHTWEGSEAVRVPSRIEGGPVFACGFEVIRKR